MVETHLAEAIAATDAAVTYDAYVKKLLADKQLLAWILKYSVSEFRDMEIADIISCISDEIEVGVRPVDPGMTNLGRVPGSGTEDFVPGEGLIIYDIRFTAYHKGREMKFLLDLEPQKSSDPSKLGYHLDYRIVFYLARMISAQKHTEFFHSDFDNIKNVRSIWLCMDQEEDGDSIEEISLVRKTVFGKETGEKEELGMMKGIIIHLRKGENRKESGNPLIALLESLFSKKSVEEKKRILEEEYGMVLTVELERKVRLMCNWSESLIEDSLKRGMEKGLEKGLEKGMEKGLERGMEKGIEMFILDNLEEKIPPMRILEKLQRRFQLDEGQAEAYLERYGDLHYVL